MAHKKGTHTRYMQCSAILDMNYYCMEMKIGCFAKYRCINVALQTKMKLKMHSLGFH